MNIYPFWRIHSAVETASDNRYDTRFDFDFATNLLLDAARERSLDGLMEKLIGACMTLPEIARVEARLIEKGEAPFNASHSPSRCSDSQPSTAH